MTNRDAEATAYRAGLDAAANDAQKVITDAEAKLKAAESNSRPSVVKAEKAYQQNRLKDAKATLAKIEKAQKADDDDQKAADKAAAAAPADKTAKPAEKPAQA